MHLQTRGAQARSSISSRSARMVLHESSPQAVPCSLEIGGSLIPISGPEKWSLRKGSLHWRTLSRISRKLSDSPLFSTVWVFSRISKFYRISGKWFSEPDNTFECPHPRALPPPFQPKPPLPEHCKKSQGPGEGKGCGWREGSSSCNGGQGGGPSTEQFGPDKDLGALDTL